MSHLEIVTISRGEKLDSAIVTPFRVIAIGISGVILHAPGAKTWHHVADNLSYIPIFSMGVSDRETEKLMILLIIYSFLSQIVIHVFLKIPNKNCIWLIQTTPRYACK